MSNLPADDRIRYQSVVEHLENPAIVVDDSWDVVYANEAFETATADSAFTVDETPMPVVSTLNLQSTADREALEDGLSAVFSADVEDPPLSLNIGVGSTSDHSASHLKLSPLRSKSGDIHGVIISSERFDRSSESTGEYQLRQEVLLENTDIIQFAFSKSGIFTYSKGKALKKLGLESDEAVGMSVFDVFERHDRIPQLCRRALDGETIDETVAVNGAVFDAHFEPIERYGTVIEVIGLAVDVTDRYERETTIADNERRLQLLFDRAPTPILVLDYEGEIVHVNDNAVQRLGYDRTDLLGRSVWDIEIKLDRDELERFIASIGPGERRQIAGRHRRADGTEFPVEVHISRFESAEGPRFICHARDVSTQREYEQRLARLHETNRELYQCHSEEGVAEIVCSAAKDLLGFADAGIALYDDDADALRPVVYPEHLTETATVPDQLPRDDTVAWEVFECGERVIEEDVTETSAFDFSEMADTTAIVEPLGNRGVLTVIENIDRELDEKTLELAAILAKNAETALDRIAHIAEIERERRRYRTLAENIPNGIVLTVDTELQVQLAAGRAFDEYGITSADLEGYHPVEVIDDPETLETTTNALQRAVKGETASTEFEFAGDPFLMHAVPMRDDSGEIDGGLAIVQDISEHPGR